MLKRLADYAVSWASLPRRFTLVGEAVRMASEVIVDVANDVAVMVRAFVNLREGDP